MADPRTLRSLDAVHLATAALAAPLEAFVVYDDRLAEAARAVGITVVQPGREPKAT
jgi:predicted nucleic acid-binding protein